MIPKSSILSVSILGSRDGAQTDIVYYDQVLDYAVKIELVGQDGHSVSGRTTDFSEPTTGSSPLNSAASQSHYKLSVIGTVSDAQKTVLLNKNQGGFSTTTTSLDSLKMEKFNSLGLTASSATAASATSPTPGLVDYLDDQVLFTETLGNLHSILPSLSTTPHIVNDTFRVHKEGNFIIITVTSKIDVGRRRALQSSNSTLTITAFLSEVAEASASDFCDAQDFDGVDPYQALDKVFKETSSDKGDSSPSISTTKISNNWKPLFQPPPPPFKKIAFSSVKLEPLISCSIHVYPLSSHGSSTQALLGIQMDTKYEKGDDKFVNVKQVVVEMPGALVTSESDSQFPISLVKGDQFHALYSVRLFDSSSNSTLSKMNNNSAMRKSLSLENSLRKSISFSIRAEVEGEFEVTSHFCARLAMNGEGGLSNLSVLANHGRLFEGTLAKYELDPFVGLEFSLNVLPPIERHKVFSVQMLISNTGTRVRNLTISLPSSTSGPSKGKIAGSLAALRHKSTPDLFMDPNELIRAYQTQLEIPATMICLESDINLQSIPPRSCRLVMLHFIVIQGTVHNLPDIHVLDRDHPEQEYVLKDTLQIYIQE